MTDYRNQLLEKRRKARKKSRAGKRKFDSISYLTGDIGLNIDRFNQAMGTFDNVTDTSSSDGAISCDGSCGGECGGCAESLTLTEAKRYVRRYYIRPQNIFCSNKAEIIKALIDLDGANCSIYTLNNLGDEKDVSKLMNSDIIYYYDKGVLYDKKRGKVMDYDLSIKKEEKRKHFANIDKAPEKEFRQEYSDRMTKETELEEAFDLDFDDINVYGEKLTEAKENLCCICGEQLDGYGNNPEPLMPYEEGRCCDGCNLKFVIPARLAAMED